MADDPGVPNHIAYWRKRARLTMQELADALDEPTTKGTISQIESAKRGFSLRRLFDIAKAVGAKPGALLDGPIQVPTEEELVSMIAEAQAEIPAGTAIGGYPRAVAASLRSQLQLYLYGRPNAPESVLAPSTPPVEAAPVQRPTKRGALG